MSDEITGNSLADRAAQLLLDGVKVNDNGLRLLAEKYTATRDALERVQMSLAGCGVIAGCNTEESFANATGGIHPDYMTASLQSVIDAVRREIDLRAALYERDRMLGEAVELIHEFSDHEKRPCSHDHHGTCQEHPGASYKGCPVAKSRAFLSAYDAGKTAGKDGA